MQFDNPVLSPFEFRYSLKKNIFCQVEAGTDFIDNISLRKSRVDKAHKTITKKEIFKEKKKDSEPSEKLNAKEEKKKVAFSQFYAQIIPQIERICSIIEDYSILDKVNNNCIKS